jgi:hypothetical protein
VIHRQVLAARTFPSGLKQIMYFVIQAISFVKRSALISTVDNKIVVEISGSHGGEYEDDCLLGCCAVQYVEF